MNRLRFWKVRRSINNGGRTPMPSAMEVYLTDVCNLRCVHCNIWTKAAVKPMMDYATLKRVFAQAYVLGVRYVGYTGGEPVLHRNFADIIRLADSIGFKQHVTTNATLMDPILAKEIAAHCDSVGVSIDGIGEVFEAIRRVSWSKVKAGLDQLLVAEANVSLGLVVTAKNIGNVWEVMDFASAHDLGLGLQPYNKGGVVMPDGMMDDGDLALRPEHADDLREILKEFQRRFPEQEDYYRLMFDYAMHDTKHTSCYVGFDKFVLEANGDLRPCHIFPVVGNVHDRTVDGLWFSEAYENLRRQMVNCRKCYLGCYEHLNIEVNRKLGSL